MYGEIPNQALFEINARLKSREIPADEMKQARVDHTTDMSKFHVSVLFSEKCFKKLIEMNNDTANNLRENGTFFYGRIKGNTLFIVDYKSDFIRTDGIYKNAAVNVSERNMLEKIVLTEKTKRNPQPYNVVVHFHTHPAYVVNDSNKIIKPNTTRYSDQDLYSYGYLQKYHQPKTENIIIYTGGLLAVDNSRSQISMVYYDPVKKDFFNINNIYYGYKGELFKFNNQDISKSKKIEDTSGIKLMKELKQD